MSEQYFKAQPTSHQAIQVITDGVAGLTLQFQTDNGVFSKERMDYGSKVLVETFAQAVDGGQYQIAELGSGYGPITIALARLYTMAQVTGVEVNERAYRLASTNSHLNQVQNTHYVWADVTEWTSIQTFDYIVTNPPIRAGKATIQTFVEVAYRQLKEGGELWLVIQKKQGAPSMEKHMEDVFGNVERISRDKGYWVLRSKKQY